MTQGETGPGSEPGSVEGPMPECGPEEPERRDDPQWEQRAERWVKVEHETYTVPHFLGEEVREGWAVVIRGTFEGLPDGDNFLVVHRASKREEADMIAGSLVSILADVIEAETAQVRRFPGLPPIAAEAEARAADAREET